MVVVVIAQSYDLTENEVLFLGHPDLAVVNWVKRFVVIVIEDEFIWNSLYFVKNIFYFI